METLASLFVTIVTVAGAVFPQVGADKLLEADKAKALSGAVLSQTTENTANTVNRPVKVAQVTNTEDRQSEFMIQLRDRVNATNEGDSVRAKREKETLEFRKRLTRINDEKKQAIVEKISERLQTLNEKWVEQWNKVLLRLAEVLTKLEKVVAEAKSEGKDVAAVEEAIALARTKILTAQAAVATQSQKTYPITISTEENLGQDVRSAINLFHNDIKNVREVVAEAKEAVVSVYQALAKVRGERVSE